MRAMRLRMVDFWNENLILRITWDEGTSIGKEEDRSLLNGLLYTRILRGLSILHFNNESL